MFSLQPFLLSTFSNYCPIVTFGCSICTLTLAHNTYYDYLCLAFGQVIGGWCPGERHESKVLQLRRRCSQRRGPAVFRFTHYSYLMLLSSQAPESLTRLIGERFLFLGIILEVQKSDSCRHCFFHKEDESICVRPGMECVGFCSDICRNDHESVSFVQVGAAL